LLLIFLSVALIGGVILFANRREQRRRAAEAAQVEIERTGSRVTTTWGAKEINGCWTISHHFATASHYLSSFGYR